MPQTDGSLPGRRAVQNLGARISTSQSTKMRMRIEEPGGMLI
ncbi:hypothetical protein [Mesorhizobium sp. 128a]